MYKPPQKKNSSWTPSTVQKKGKSPSKLGHFSIQPKSNPSSTSSQEIGEYSRDSADRLTANVMRGIQAKKQEEAERLTLSEAEGSTLQPKFESPWAPTFEPPPPLPESPASKLKGAFAPVSKKPIQRQCAECASEENEQKGEEKKDLEEIGIQTKLTVGAPGDAYEQEADRMASQVMSMSAPPDSSASVQRQLDTNHPHHPKQIWRRAQSIKPVMQRQIDPRVQMREMIQRAHLIDGNQASGDLESRLNASKGGGSPLSENVRGFMEPRFGADFSGVRVHTGGEAVQMNQELGAQAFTHGSDVYFGAGKEPGNNELTAHELTHVVQQSSNKVPSTQRKKENKDSSSDEATLADIQGHAMFTLLPKLTSLQKEVLNNEEAGRLVGGQRLVTAMRAAKAKKDGVQWLEFLKNHDVELSKLPKDQVSDIMNFLNFLDSLADIQGHAMFNLLPKLASLPKKVLNNEEAGRLVGGSRLVTAMHVVKARDEGIEWSYFLEAHRYELSALPNDQVLNIMNFLSSCDSSNSSCPPQPCERLPKKLGKTPETVSERLIKRLIGKYASIDGDPGEGCREKPYIAGYKEGYCTFGYGDLLDGKGGDESCPIIDKTTGKKPTKEKLNKIDHLKSQDKKQELADLICDCNITTDCSENGVAENKLRATANAVAKIAKAKIPVDLNQDEVDAFADISLASGHIPNKLIEAINSYWCTDAGKDYVRAIYLQSALTGVGSQKVVPAFVKRRQYRAWKRRLPERIE